MFFPYYPLRQMNIILATLPALQAKGSENPRGLTAITQHRERKTKAIMCDEITGKRRQPYYDVTHVGMHCSIRSTAPKSVRMMSFDHLSICSIGRFIYPQSDVIAGRWEQYSTSSPSFTNFIPRPPPNAPGAGRERLQKQGFVDQMSFTDQVDVASNHDSSVSSGPNARRNEFCSAGQTELGKFLLCSGDPMSALVCLRARPNMSVQSALE